MARHRAVVMTVDELTGVATIRMNLPAKLNAWTPAVYDGLCSAFDRAARDARVRAAVYTGTGAYFSTGGDFVGLMRSAAATSPWRLRPRIAALNERMFENFVGFPKPLVAAVNGPAIGGGATSVALCDEVVAAARSAFSTPFAALGVTPEGCSSVVFPRRFGEGVARRMLGDEGWQPSARDALAFGLVDEIVDDADADADAEAGALVAAARDRAAALADARAPRRFGDAAELRAVNAAESRRLADAFVSTHFLDTMVARAERRGAKGAREARLFGALRATHGVWSRFV